MDRRRIINALLASAPTGRVLTPVEGPHVRTGRSVDRMMLTFQLALLPVLVSGIYNTGWQALEALRSTRSETVPGWRGNVQAWLAADPGFAPSAVWDCLATGALYVLPVLLTVLVAGFLCQSLFAWRRGHRTDGLLLYALILTLLLPPSVPLWQAAVAMAFGMIFGNEMFGGWGRTLVHPAILAAAFALLSFPDPSSGHMVWDGLGSFDGSPRFVEFSIEGAGALTRLEQSWTSAFLGLQPGPMGAASPLAALLGGALLLARRIISWRVMAGGGAGLILAVLLSQLLVAPGHDPLMDMTWFWHMVLGSGIFALVCVAADPAMSAMTNPGRWLTGILTGAAIILIRLANPAHPDGVVLALLLGGVAVPLIDYAVMWLNIRRREARHGP
jgi:Na+-transporting NADH:ubiquinone oxidoreductase subunit B